MSVLEIAELNIADLLGPMLAAVKAFGELAVKVS
jgi:hypothetical protein